MRMHNIIIICNRKNMRIPTHDDFRFEFKNVDTNNEKVSKYLCLDTRRYCDK